MSLLRVLLGMLYMETSWSCTKILHIHVHFSNALNKGGSLWGFGVRADNFVIVRQLHMHAGFGHFSKVCINMSASI